MQLIGEANNKGYLDFMQSQNAFKAKISTSLASLHVNSLKYTWYINDSSQVPFSSSQLSKYQNSVSVPTNLLTRSNQYTVSINITDGFRNGFIFSTYPA